MKKAILPVLLVAAAIILTFMITKWTVTASAEAKSGFHAAVLGMQMKFLKSNSLLRPIVDVQKRPDLQKYLNEANTLMAWFFREPVAELWKKFPARNDPEAIIKGRRKEAQEEGAKKRAAQGNLPIWEECYKMVREIYDEFKGNKYNSLASDYQGSVRLDVHRVVKGEGNKLRWELVIWGGIGPIVHNGWVMRWYKTPTAQEKTDYEKALAEFKKSKKPAVPGEEPKDPNTLAFAQSQSGTGHPVLPDFEGAEYITDFPPGATINYWFTPTCPPEAERLEVEFRVKSRAMSGEDQEMSFLFSLPVDSGWKGSWDGVMKIEAQPNY